MRPTDAKTWIEIDGGALRHNAAILRNVIGPDCRFMAVVKSNAYGHGLPETIRALKSSVDWFGVDALTEAVAVRAAGSKKPILIMGYIPPAEIAAAIRADFSFVIYQRATLRIAAKTASRRHPAKVHLKIETGTVRQGIDLKNLVAFTRALKRQPHVIVEGVSTHFANIEDTLDSSYARRQLDKFHEALRILERQGLKPRLLHTAASGAALLYPETHMDMVRGGIALYGIWPSRETRIALQARAPKLQLRPALCWKTIIAQIKDVPPGTPISYGLTERVSRQSRVAVLPIGYWDGYDRGLSSIGQVLIRGQRAKILGRICMNMMMADVTDIPGAKPEDEVVLLGQQGDEEMLTDELAGKIGSINYEVLARLNPVVPRRLV